MKILWLINIPLPEVSELLGVKPSPFGGWLINASKDLARNSDVNLSIAFPFNRNEVNKIKGQKVDYFTFNPIDINSKSYKEPNVEMINILKAVEPDLVHIYGTEFSHSQAMINACDYLGIETVVSIQGLVSIYEKHMYANLPFKAIYGYTFRNLLLRDNVYGERRSFKIRGINEKKAIKETNNIIGRTTWDKACTSQINPDASYHFCNETLREEFYDEEWSHERCEKHSIFLSQGQYSIKGMHYVLEAMPIILKRFPNTKLYIGGKNIIKNDTVRDRLLMTYYGKYIKKMIKILNLEDKVFFTGPLNTEQMLGRFLKSNVFVCPSSIENSPNSLGEAMILGVPCVASNVGGISDMMKHEEEGYVYQTDAPYMMAHYICQVFENVERTLELSKKSKVKAQETHNVKNNTINLLKIYNRLLSTK